MDLTKASWIFAIPEISDRSILLIGTLEPELLDTLLHFKPQTIYCLGRNNPGENPPGVIVLDRLDAIADRTFDILIVDEINFLQMSDGGGQEQAMGQLAAFIKAEGCILIRSRRGIQYLLSRLRMLLRIKQFGWQSASYICNPCVTETREVFLLKRSTEWLLSFRERDKLEQDIVSRIIIRLRNLFFSLGGSLNPFRGLAVILSRKNMPEGNSKFKELISDTLKRYANTEREEEVAVLYNCRYRERLFIKIYDIGEHELLAFLKVSFERNDSRWTLKQERNNYDLLRSAAHNANGSKLCFPQASSLERPPYFNALAECPARGTRLTYLVRKILLADERDSMADLLKELTGFAIAWKKTISTIPTSQLHHIEPVFFSDYLGVLPIQLDPSSFTSTQHADFWAGNIFLDRSSRTFTLIDMDWLACGYPEMLDLYFMLSSFYFLEKKQKGIYEKFSVDVLYTSFTQTYFGENWFGGLVKDSINQYCKEFGIRSDQTYQLFLCYLYFCCNKYRVFNVYNYQDLYERCLLFALKNREQFVALT